MSEETSEGTISPEGLEGLLDGLEGVVKKAGSLEEVEEWLRSRPYVESVRTMGYLVKVEPPRKELVVAVRMDDGSVVKKTVDVILHPDGRLGLAGVHGV